LGKVKYIVDFFQREYRWQKRHVEQLIDDLSTKFLTNYKRSQKIRCCHIYGEQQVGGHNLREQHVEAGLPIEQPLHGRTEESVQAHQGVGEEERGVEGEDQGA